MRKGLLEFGVPVEVIRMKTFFPPVDVEVRLFRRLKVSQTS